MSMKSASPGDLLSKHLRWTDSRRNVGISWLSSWESVCLIVWRRDKELAWVFALPFLYLISKSSSARRSIHRISLLLGSLMVRRQCNAAWSVYTVNVSYMKHGRRIFKAQITARHSRSDAGYFSSARSGDRDQKRIVFRLHSGWVRKNPIPMP